MLIYHQMQSRVQRVRVRFGRNLLAYVTALSRDDEAT